MNSTLRITPLILLALLAFGSCTSQSSNNNEKKAQIKIDIAELEEDEPSAFPLPEVPIMITNPQESVLFLSKHYWDLFPFADTSLISQPDITEQGFVDYIQILNLVSFTEAESSLQITLNKAKENSVMYNHFASLFEKYLYNPNSPFRNDELYIPVVDNLLKSGLLFEANKVTYGFEQEMILKNRLGTIATDFVYTLANGEKEKMHNLKSDYLILFVTNPDCPTCAAVTKEMDNSTTLHSISSLNSSDKSMLTVLSIYPDSNTDEWRKALPYMPQKGWVNAYDDGLNLTNKRLYDIKAIPTLYLLDKNKKIILKDTSLEDIENYFMKIR